MENIREWLLKKRDSRSTYFAFLLLLLVVLCGSCMSPGKVRVTAVDELKEYKITKSPIVVLPLIVRSIHFNDDEPLRNYKAEGKLRKLMLNTFFEMGAKHKIQLKRSPNAEEAGSDTYTQVLALRRNISDATSLQRSFLNENTSSRMFESNLFVDPPLINPDFIKIKDIGSKFVLFTRILDINTKGASYKVRARFGYGHNFYMHLYLIDLASGKVIYKEERKAPSRYSKKILYPLVYNSLGNLKTTAE